MVCLGLLGSYSTFVLLLKAWRELFREIDEPDSGYHFNLAIITRLGTEPAEELADDRELTSISEALEELAKADPSGVPSLPRNPSTNPFFDPWKVCLARFPGGAVA